MAARFSTATRPPDDDGVPALSHWLARARVRHAASRAIVAEGQALSYAQLGEMVARARARLDSAGAQPSDRIAIAATRSVETIVAILACVDAGVGYVPLDLSYPAERLAAMIDASRPRLVMGDEAALEQLRASVPEFPTLERPAAREAVHAAQRDLAYVLFTSGSTGTPKGVAMGALPLRYLIAWHAAHPRLGQPACTLQFAPLSFDVHFQEILSTVACGGTLVLLPDTRRRDPAQLHAAIVEHGVQRLFLPYVALQMLAEASRVDPPRSLREVVSAGEQLQVTPVIRALFRALPDAQLHNHYGPTESHVVTAHELTGDAAAWPEIPPIGKALPHVRLALEQAETEAGVETGELLLGGKTLAHGYIGREDLTAERFREDATEPGHRWYVTGDLVRRDADGVVTYLGRADDQVKVDGFRIEPGEIELALMRHAVVRDAVVTAPVIPGAGRQLVAHLVLREPVDDLPAALRGHLRGQVPDYMVPVRYVVLDHLPTTPSGKINRRGLPLPEPEPTPTANADPVETARELWCQLLGVSSIAPDQNLFDLGARSLMVLRFVARLRELGIDGLSVTDIYDRPTLRGITERLRGGSTDKRTVRGRAAAKGARGGNDGIAIVGMAARAGDAADVEQLWQQLVAGKESLRRFGPHEIDPAVPAEMRQRPNFVAARGVLENAARFDAGFFGISPREAVLIDPQQRLLLELCWTALEQAGIDPSRRDGRVGVYAGTANNSYITSLRDEQPELIQQAGEFAAMLASEKDYVATRIAHRLDLDGPAVSIHTACSTGLVAVAQAWHALASGQCDVALAGGATVVVPQHGGYLHVEGGMESADGRCRPFDAEASGTVFGSGGAVVVLKRLEDALADGDHVHAVIRGVGLNNDGADKASFTAPSVSGQAGAIVMALEAAGVDPRSIGYVEAHGTGTALGDPIEVAALTRAWREYTPDSGYCLLGSAKGHLGHTVAAAGVFGLIKAALSLERELIPATLHYRAPNPQIDFGSTPFVPVAGNTAWPRGTETRRAAVSSFGVGGTNAHVVLEEAPVAPVPAEAGHGADGAGNWLLPLSARSAEAVLRRASALADHLEAKPSLPMSRVFATLVRGRQPMAHRLSVVARDARSAAAALRAARSSVQASTAPRVVFLFPGQGSQHPGMVRGLYDEMPAFRAAFDACLEQLSRRLDAPWRAWLIEADRADADVAEKLAETRHAQPALFSVSYAMAAWLESLGIEPDAMIGHSIGEYAAACRAGVFSLEDAIATVVARGQAMFEQPRGAMLAVQSDAQKVAAMLPAGIEIAGCNAPALTVVAGSHEAIAAFAAQLAAQEIGTTALKVSHAFHSASMDGALPAIERALADAALAAPRRTVYSCVSGAALRADEASTPAYWARQVRAAVRFDKAVLAELAHPDTVFIEVGPGQALTALLRQYRTAQGKPPRVVPLLGRANIPGEPAVQALLGLGAAWCAGVAVRWPVPAGAPRATLPAYPFSGQDYWFVRAAKRSGSAQPDQGATSPLPSKALVMMSRIPRLQRELTRIVSDVSGLQTTEVVSSASFLDLGLDSLSLTQATAEIERTFGLKLRFRRLLEDLDSVEKLASHLDAELAPERFVEVTQQPASQAALQSPVSQAAVLGFAPITEAMPTASSGALSLQNLVQQQLQLMAHQLALLSGQPAATALPAVLQPTQASSHPGTKSASAEVAGTGEEIQPSTRQLVEKPFGASARINLNAQGDFNAAQQRWLSDFIARYNARTAGSKSFSQLHRHRMADPRVVTGFDPRWKELVYPIVADRSEGARIWDIDGNEYIDILSGFGANLLGYGNPSVTKAIAEQAHRGVEVGPQHPLSAEVADLISEFTGMERVAFCNTGSEAVMGAMRIARTVTRRKLIAIFTNSYHGIFDEVIVRGTRQLRSLSAAPGILANAVENVLVLDWASEDSLRVLRERADELAAIMTEPIQNKLPTLQPRAFVHSLREIADRCGCALIFDEVVTGFRVCPGGAQEFYGVRADIATYGKIIGGGLPFAAIAGSSRWLDALDGGHWQFGDDSYPEAGVTYFAGTFVRHPLALAAARATLLHLKKGGPEFYRRINDRTQAFIDRLNDALAARGAPVKAVHCASLWRLSWDDGQRCISLFYYLARFHGLHLYEQFGHFVTEAMGEAELDRIFTVITRSLDELMALGFITPRPGGPSKTLAPAADEGGLAPGQTERWLAASLDQHARTALNESLCLVLRGHVDDKALETAVNDTLQRHDAFRLSFDPVDPVQRIDRQLVPTCRWRDLSSRTDSNAALDDFCQSASQREFVLERAPQAEVTLLKLADGRRVVHLVASHLIFDGWASGILLDDIAHAYRARCAGAAPRWSVAAGSPLDFAMQQQALWSSSDAQRDLAYWRTELANPPAPLALGDLAPPASRRYGGNTLRAEFGAAQLKLLQELGRKRKATLFQLLLAALAVALQRRSQQSDFVIGIPFASQSIQPGVPIIADGVLDLPLRLRLDNKAPFEATLAQTRARLLDALDHPLVTQATAAREVGAISVGHRPALTGVLFNLNPRLDTRPFLPLEASTHEGRKMGLLGELLYNFYEEPERLTLDLHYSTEFFSSARAASLVDELRAVLEEIYAADAPARIASPASVTSEADRWNQTERDYDATLRLGDLIRRGVSLNPHAVAVRFEGHELSYRELDAQAWALANQLRRAGVGPGDLVGVCMHRSLEMVVALVGSVYSGGAYVPLDPDYPHERIAGMCEDAAFKAIITRPAEQALAGRAFPSATPVIHVDAKSHVDPQQARGELIGEASDAAYVIFTSGSTGRPKGALNSHRGVVNWLLWMQDEYRLLPSDRVVQKTPYSFDVSLREFFWPLTVGATIVVARPEGHRDPEYLAELFDTERITLAHFVPSMLRIFLDEPDLADRCRSLRRVICSGEALPFDLVERFFERLPFVQLCNLYGPTEAAVEVTYWECRPKDPRGIVPIGRPVANTRMYVLDERLQPVPAGREGDLYISGVQVGMGYLARPGLTAERFVPDPFRPGQRMYKTGDVARWLEDGAIEYLGRSDHQVKIRGNRIELGEIEGTVMRHPSVARCVVTAHDFGNGDLRLVGYVVGRTGLVDVSALKAMVAEHLPAVMVPQHWVDLPQIPLLSNGKIDRKSLPAPAEAAHQPAAAATPVVAAPAGPATDPNVATIARVMAQLLKREAVGADEHFFELGGHSLLAAQLSSRLGEALGQRPGLRAIFEAPTPARLARAMAEKAALAQAKPAPVIPRREDQSTAPLSLMQQRMWFLENLTPGTDVNNIPTGHRLTGALDEQAFERAFQLLLQRQSALRTIVERTPTGDRQRVLDSLDFSLLPIDDLSSMPEPERMRQLQSTISRMIAEPFDLEHGPLFRAKLWRLGPDDHAFLFLPHHIVWDAWSFDLLYAEFSELYEACRLGRAPSLAPIRVSYGDFAAWQLEWMSGKELKRQVDHWIERLSPLPPALELPADRPRPPVMTGRGGSHQFLLPPDVTGPLQTLASERGTTLYVMLLSAYNLLLHRMSKLDDFVVGTPVRGRELPELEPLMGFFVNMLPLRSQFDESMTMRQWIARTHETVVDAFAYPDVPFEHLVRLLNPPRDASRPPIHQVSFSYQDVRDRPTKWGNLEHQRMATAQGGAPQDLALWCVMTRKNLEFVFTFNADVFNEPGIALFGQRLRSLLLQMIERPDQALAEYSVIPESEGSMQEKWNTTEAPLPADPLVHRMFAAQAHRSDRSIAVEQTGQRSLSYAELDRASNRLAHALRARGIARGALVGLCLERRPDMVVAMLAIAKSGAGYVPLDPEYPAARLAYMAKHSRLNLLLTASSTTHALEWPRENVLMLDVDASEVESQPDTDLPPSPSLDAQPEDPLYVIYTSGSTGEPKGVTVPHRAVANFLASMAKVPGMDATSRIVAVTTLSFDISVLELFLPLTTGASLTLAARRHLQDGEELRLLVESSAANVLQATPTTWRMLVDAGWRPAGPFKGLIGGEPMPADLAATLLERGVELWNMYGPTETTVWSTCWKVENPAEGISIGTPIANTQIHVLDERLRPCPVGVAGEIWIGGTGVSSGYLYRPELSAERFIDDPFRTGSNRKLYRTGDKGRWRPDGKLEHLGRLDSQIKLRGYRIELNEIEAALSSCQGVGSAVAAVRATPSGDQRLVAYVVPRGPMPTAELLRDHVRATLPEYMLPQAFMRLDSLPLLPNGKINRAALPELPIESSGGGSAQPLSSDAERAIAEIWSKLLGLEQIGPQDNFFDLGGHSLLAMRVVTEVRQRLGFDLSVRRLVFESLSQIAASAEESGAQADAAVGKRGSWLSRWLKRG